VALTAQDRAPYFWLKRNLIVFAAMIADYLKTFRRILSARCLLRAAFWTALRRHQIPLIKDLLFLLSK
jgi:hypothetical protein